MIEEKRIIIVVEDDPLVSLYLKIILEDAGFKVVSEIQSVEDTIASIKILNPVLVILDINLNMEKDGIYIGNFLLKLDKIPHVYITSSMDNNTMIRVQETRPYGFFTKPIDPNSIVININIILNNYQHRHVDVVRKVFGDTSIISETPFLLKKVVQYINDNIFNLIEIDQLVILTNWDKDHFIRMFTKYLGVTPYQYILQLKMQKAMVFLVETELNIGDIAYDLGFNSVTNFCVRFKKIVGVSPNDFRKINKSKKWLNN